MNLQLLILISIKTFFKVNRGLSNLTFLFVLKVYFLHRDCDNYYLYGLLRTQSFSQAANGAYFVPTQIFTPIRPIAEIELKTQ